jgi:hypothetical protein
MEGKNKKRQVKVILSMKTKGTKKAVRIILPAKIPSPLVIKTEAIILMIKKKNLFQTFFIDNNNLVIYSLTMLLIFSLISRIDFHPIITRTEIRD